MDKYTTTTPPLCLFRVGVGGYNIKNLKMTCSSLGEIWGYGGDMGEAAAGGGRI
jgi:hypothetical protein